MQDENQPATETSTPMSLMGRITGVLSGPGEVFDSIKSTAPATANWLVPMLILMVLGLLSAFTILNQPAIKRQISDIQVQAIEKQIAAKKIPPQQAEAMRAAVEKFGSIGTKIGMVVGPTMYAVAMPFWWGLLMWGIGQAVFKAPLGYMKAVEVAGLSSIVIALGTVVKTLLVIGTGSLFASTSPALLLKTVDPTAPIFQVLASFDLFGLWALGVRSVGLAWVTGVSSCKASAWVYGVWLVVTGLMLGMSIGVQVLSNSLSR